MATYQESPQWVRAADSHNLAAHRTSAFDDPEDNEPGFFGRMADRLSRTPEFLSVSIASGINSFYNTGIAISNVFREEDEKLSHRDTGQWIADYDEDLGKYYEENKTAADLTGFIGGAFIPGLGGVKALTAGQRALQVAARGEVGANFTRATGLIAPNTQMYVRKHGAELASRNAQWSMWNANSLRHVRNHTWQGALEGLAFEGAVMATMFESPIFDDMDTWDIVKNMGIGVTLGAGVGTVIGGATSYFGTQRLVRNADARQIALATGASRVAPRGLTREADNITASAFDRDIIAKPVTYDDVLNMKKAQGEAVESLSVEAINAEVRHLNQLRESNLEKLGNQIRTSVHKVHQSNRVKKDNGWMANTVADVFQNMNSREGYELFENMKFFGRLADDSDFQKEVRRVMREASEAGTPISRQQAVDIVGRDTTAYVQLHSGGIGNVLDSDPRAAARLADSMSPDQIKDYIKKQKFAPKKIFNLLEKANPRMAEARWLWARELGKLLDDKTTVHAYDLPLLEKAVRDGNTSLMVALPDGELSQLSSLEEITDFYRKSQLEVAERLKQVKDMDTSKMEAITNIRRDFLEGAPTLDPTDLRNLDAQGSYAEELTQHLGKNVSAADLHYRPKFMKASYNDTVTDMDGNVLRGMQMIEYGNKLYAEAATKAVAYALGPETSGFMDYPKELLRRVWRGGIGQGRVTNAGGGYDTVESITSANGTMVSYIERQRMKELREELTGSINTLLQDSNTAVRFSVLNEQIAAQTERFVLNADGTALVPRKMRDYETAMEEFAQGLRSTEPELPKLAEGTPEAIELTEELAPIVRQHIDLTARRNDRMEALYTAQGRNSRKYEDTYYPVRQDPRQFKHFAFVVDPKLSGVGHKRMVLARTGEELEAQLNNVPSQYRIVRKDQSEEYHKALGDWMYDRTLHENYLDTDLTSRGIRSNFFPHTDPQTIADTFLQHHIRGENALIREGVATQFAPFINEMERLGQIYAQTHGSSTEHISRLAVSTKNNPYMAQVKSLFNISRLEDAPQWWLSANQSLDRMVSTAWNRVTDIFRTKHLVDDDAINQINNIMDEVGFKSAYYDAATNVLANTRVNQGVLSKFVRTANAFLTATILRLDPFNALNNKLGNQVIMSAEIHSLLNAIKNRNPEVAGRLSELSTVSVPGTGGDAIFSPWKLVGKAYADVVGPGREEIIARYRQHGLVPDLTDQLYKALDSMTLSGAETATDLTKKTEQIKQVWNGFVERGSKVTGNELSERLNRVAAARVMEQITDAAIEAGVLRQGEQWSFINTFVNRVNGAVRAAERPLMFQGPIGQAMGLFQSYQFNLIQQSLRHIGEGRAKTMAIMAGMQTSIYGASSLPGFSAINQYLVGGASGNVANQDLYSASQAIFGKEGMEWLMYGAPSNILGSALYSRGNTNPRVWHVVPNPANPSDLPFIGAFGQTLGSLKRAVTSVQQGAPVWESVLHGLEHAGLSRPLAGMAATARGFTNDGVAYSTQRSGNFLYSNDLMSLATLSRIAGAKPLDEAIMQNNYFRVQAYAASDRRSRNKIGEAIRTTIQAGGVPDNAAINRFADAYVQRGGNAANFNQYFMDQYRNATTSQAEQLARNLNNPYGRSMMYLMDGDRSGVGFADIYPR